VWNAIRPFFTFSFGPWKEPASETLTLAKTARMTMTTGRAPLRRSKTRKAPTINSYP
jgi:hypothetical protein